MGLSCFEFAKKVSERVWGFIPDRQVKPVHFANGFIRALAGQRGRPSLLQKAAGGFRRGKAGLTTQQLLAEIDGKFVCGSQSVAERRASNLRLALDLVLGQDRALFAKGPFSLTLTHLGHTTGDPSDRGTGEFLAEVIAADASEAVDVLRQVSVAKTDNIYLLTMPLIEEVELGAGPEGAGESEVRIHKDSVLVSLQRSFRRVVKYEADLEKTTFLQRVVDLGCLGLILYVVNIVNEDRPAKVPVLLASPDRSSEVLEASRATFRRARQRVRIAFGKGVREEMVARGQDQLGVDEYLDIMKQWLPELGRDTRTGRRHDQIFEQFTRDFEAFQSGSDSVFDAFCKAATGACFLAMSTTGGGEDPEGFVTGLGRLSGLVFPRSGGRGAKYYRPAPQLLDMLVMSLLEPSEEVSFEDFWRRAWDEFGLMSGALGSIDAERLADYGVKRTTSEGLSRNGRQILEQYVQMGHAREFADDVATIRAGGLS